MFQQFIDRKEELATLNTRFKSDKPEFILLYGRRRVGKTELAIHFSKDKPTLYFLAEEKRYADNLSEMRNIMADYLKDEEFKLIKFENWVQLFKSFLQRLKTRTVLIIDEFPYLVKENNSIPSEFQKIWDMYLSKSDKVILIIIGSSVSMMEKLLGRKSPLFGRRTAQLEIMPLSPFNVQEFLPQYSVEDCIKVYGCTDGIPLYLKQFNPELNVTDNIKNIFLKKDAILCNEAELLLKQEFREPANYFAILKAIAFGYIKQHEIADHTEIDKSIISKYIKNLETIRILRRIYPITEKKERKQSARYEFSDNYFNFWFRFIYPNKTLIEHTAEEAFDTIKKDYNTYLGHIFEKVGEDFLWNAKPFKFTKLGRWWHKDREIDIIALDETANNAFFFECKWTELKQHDATKILEELKNKAKSVIWRNSTRKEHFGLIAKHIIEKEKLRKEGYFAFDIDDFEKIKIR